METKKGRTYSKYNEYVAVSGSSWGRGFSYENALATAAMHLRSYLDDHDQDEVGFAIYQVPVDADWSIEMFSFRADEIREVVNLNLPTEDVIDLSERADSTYSLAERLVDEHYERVDVDE